MPTCDVCGAAISQEVMRVLPGAEIVAVTNKGFVPAKLPLEEACLAQGSSRQQVWLQTVARNRANDWGLCGPCSSAVKNHARGLMAFKCACGKQLNVKSDLAGKRVKCPACGQPVKIPGEEKPTVPTALVKVRVLSRFDASVVGLAFAANGREALAARMLGLVERWDLGSAAIVRGKEIGSFDAEEMGAADTAAFSPDGKFALFGWSLSKRHALDESPLHLWNLKTAEEVHRLTKPSGWFQQPMRDAACLAFTPDGKHALSGSSEGLLRLWDLEEGEMLGEYKGHAARSTSVAISPAGRHALSAAWEPAVVLWNIDEGKVVHRLEGHTNPVRAVAFSDDSRLGLTGGGFNPPATLSNADRATLDFFSETERAQKIIAEHNAPRDYSVRLWDLKTAKQLRCFEGHDGPVLAVAFLPGQAHCLSAGGDEMLRLWSIKTGAELCSWNLPAWTRLAFSSDRRRLLTSTKDGSVILWELTTSPPESAQAEAPKSGLSRCRYWMCSKCQGGFEKEDLDTKLPQWSNNALIMGTFTCRQCGTDHSAHDVYAGRHDVPRKHWPRLEKLFGKPAQVTPIPTAPKIEPHSAPAPEVYGLSPADPAVKPADVAPPPVSGNLPPGTIVPQAGTWECEGCGDGAVAGVLFAMNAGDPQVHMTRTRRHFEKGEKFPSCPNCKRPVGDLTGWSLAEPVALAERVADSQPSATEESEAPAWQEMACGCGHRWTVDKTLGGKRILCPKCNQRVTVPKSTVDQVTEACPKCGFKYAWDGSLCGHCKHQGPKRPIKPKTSAQAGDMADIAGIAVTCSCGNRWEVDNTLAGIRIRCMKCNQRVTVPPIADHAVHVKPLAATAPAAAEDAEEVKVPYRVYVEGGLIVIETSKKRGTIDPSTLLGKPLPEVFVKVITIARGYGNLDIFEDVMDILR